MEQEDKIVSKWVVGTILGILLLVVLYSFGNNTTKGWSEGQEVEAGCMCQTIKYSHCTPKHAHSGKF